MYALDPPQHRRNRLELCYNRSSWLLSDLHCIVFRDESHFTLETNEHHLHVWRGRGQWSQSAFVLQRRTAMNPDETV
ncbi:transposable element Tcb1 transposase [Trichonephila clavipes]|nr:transposable element Tcb1 transposase [Trichonephila clavipes]